MAVPQITLYVDIVSPFAYIAFHVLKNSSTFAKCNVTYVPIFLGGVDACFSYTDKDKWMGTERMRWAKYFNVPMTEKFPEGFPPKTLAVQRALCAISQKFPEKLPAVIEAVYRSFWVDENTRIGDVEGFAPVFETVLGQKATQEVLSAMTQGEVKADLTANTDKSFKEGAFDLPWFQCTNAEGKTEGFWGIDHLGVVADFLGLDRSRESGFRALL
ncbi:thioredoxin-like protein [Penicillium waksmanii]|uniref:thioredoxin-like protein n=1 Tax=Penicillium waksmanii TaxID=69791 RepID=UPI0025482469|nr:thioredoxin-like protein [Penicillium waksmanii]KAJ6000261.1 thioredoxin-like protein [Penicillium waksmanii]